MVILLGSGFGQAATRVEIRCNGNTFSLYCIIPSKTKSDGDMPTWLKKGKKIPSRFSSFLYYKLEQINLFFPLIIYYGQGKSSIIFVLLFTIKSPIN